MTFERNEVEDEEEEEEEEEEEATYFFRLKRFFFFGGWFEEEEEAEDSLIGELDLEGRTMGELLRELLRELFRELLRELFRELLRELLRELVGCGDLDLDRDPDLERSGKFRNCSVDVDTFALFFPPLLKLFFHREACALEISA